MPDPGLPGGGGGGGRLLGFELRLHVLAAVAVLV